MDHALLIISFHGIMGDFSKPQLWQQQGANQQQPTETGLLANLNIRNGLVKGLRFLCQNFQVIIYNNYTSDFTDQSQKDGAEKIKQLLQQSNITVDAIYSSNVKASGPSSYVSEDFSQIFIDFNLTSLKKISEKALFVSSLEVDNMGPCEQINIDKKGFFMFDSS